MSTTVRILVYQAGPRPQDIDAISEANLLRQGRDPEALAAALGDRARWWSMQVKDAEALLEEQIYDLTLVGDAISGFRHKPGLLPRARVQVLLEGWSEPVPPSMEAAGKLHPNLLSAIDQALQVHLRPSMNDSSDFLAVWRDNGKPSEKGPLAS